MNSIPPKSGSGIKNSAHQISPFAGVWARIGLLFGALCLIKILLLVTYRRYLFEIHWRISSLASGPVGEAAFYLFALLVGLNLWVLGGRCAAAGMKATRTVNFCVLGLGTAFILLTFHAGDKNYLLAWMNGILTWKNIGWYLIENSCFGPPYLAAWVLAYTFGYYFLARTGRERWMLRVTALCAAAYTALCLSGLAANRDGLVAVDCLGLVSFVSSLAAGRRALRLGWACGPLLAMGFFYALFIPCDNALRHPDPEFTVLSAGSLVLFAGVTLLVWRGGAYVAWSWGLPFAYSAFLILVNTNYVLAANYTHLLSLGLALPHYFLGEFAVASILFALASAHRLLLPKDPLWWLDAINLILIALALVGLQTSRIMGARLDWQLLQFGNSPLMMWRLAQAYLPEFFGILAASIVVYTVALLMIRKRFVRMLEAGTSPGRNSGWFALSAFLLLGVAGWSFTSRDKVEGQTTILLADTSPLWRRTVEPPMSLEQFTATARQLSIPLLATAPPPPGTESAPRDLNVVLIFQESSYNEYLSLFDGTNNTEPLLSRYKNRMEVFPNFYSNFAGSIWARFATFMGLYPVQDFRKFTERHVPVKSLFEILDDHGYSCSLFESSFLDYTDFRDLLSGRDLDAIYDSNNMPAPRKYPPVDWGVREEVTLAAMQEQIKTYAAEKKKFFLTYVPAAPHNPFDSVSDRFRTRPMRQFGDFTPAYLNSLTYMDWIMASLIDQLKTSGLLGKTLIIITDDHGEMLGQNGGPVGHGWTVTPELANIPLIIIDPARQRYTVNDTVGSQVDLLPTILDRLNIPLPGGQIYEGASLDSPGPDPTRLIYLNSFQQFAVVKDRELVCGDEENGGTQIPRSAYDISNQGARTIFTQTDAPDFALPPISRFDKFQENFLANYEYYCRLLQLPAR